LNYAMNISFIISRTYIWRGHIWLGSILQDGFHYTYSFAYANEYAFQHARHAIASIVITIDILVVVIIVNTMVTVFTHVVCFFVLSYQLWHHRCFGQYRIHISFHGHRI